MIKTWQNFTKGGPEIVKWFCRYKLNSIQWGIGLLYYRGYKVSLFSAYRGFGGAVVKRLNSVIHVLSSILWFSLRTHGKRVSQRSVESRGFSLTGKVDRVESISHWTHVIIVYPILVHTISFKKITVKVKTWRLIWPQKESKHFG